MRLGLGCVSLGSASGRGSRADVGLVREAVDRGVALFDTADAYASGNSERVLGRAVRGRRAAIQIATKAGYRFRPRSGPEQVARRLAGAALGARAHRSGGARLGGTSYADQDLSPDHLRHALDASLRRLRTDHVDVFQLHGPRAVLPDVVPALQELVMAGKVRRIGIGAERVEDALAWVRLGGVDVVQVPFGVLDPEAAQDLLPTARSRGVEVWARGVFGGGLLAAASRGDPAVAADPKASIVADLQTLAREAGVDVFALAMGFVRAHDAIGAVLVGTSSPDHLRRDLALFDQPPLTDDVVARLRRLVNEP